VVERELCTRTLQYSQKFEKQSATGRVYEGLLGWGRKVSPVMNGEREDSPEWFALRVRTNHEKVVAKALDGKDLTCFLPTFESAKAWSDRVKRTRNPLFPGYLFCRVNRRQRRTALVVPGAMNFVGVGSTPIPIPDADIESLQRLIASLKVKPWPFLRVGQKVRIERGPLAGVEGIIESFRSGFRIVVSIELLQRSVAAEVQGDLLKPLVAWSTKSGEEGLERAARS